MEILKEALNVFLCYLPMVVGAILLFFKVYRDEQKARQIYDEMAYAVTNYYELAHARLMLECMEDVNK